MNDESEHKGGRTDVLSPEELDQLRTTGQSPVAGAGLALEIFHRDGVRVVPLVDGASVVIGRYAPADVTVRDSSMSRQHACVERVDGEVWIEDLGSTNGSWIGGERITRAPLTPGGEVVFGAVVASLTAGGALGRWGLESHDGFVRRLDAELARSRLHRRRAVLLMTSGGAHQRLASWLPVLRRRLRPFDLIALYSARACEILLPEVDEAEARSLAGTLMRGLDGLRTGLAVYPDHGSSTGELLEGVRSALREADGDEPLRTAAPVAQRTASPEEMAGGPLPVVQSAAMGEVFRTASRLASSAIPVLITGETGTGKEVVARFIASSGKRTGKPLVCVNCGAIPGQLIESTLFGHVKGAFTGASGAAKGVFEAADGGTVLLDEVGELPAAAQAALLRVLEDKRLTRVGATREIEVDVRVLAATHRDLLAMCEANEFRLDLYYRLNAMTLTIPPLRERTEEIEPLVERFVEQANRTNDCHVNGIDEAAMAALCAYPWPGNVRELRNAVERAVVIAYDETITVDELPEPVRELAAPGEPAVAIPTPQTSGDAPLVAVNLKEKLGQVEADLIIAALSGARWNREEAARALGVSLRTLARRMAAHGIRRVSYGRDERGDID
jgi:DNA-binding NtrC family response regulator/pSer/pThr/pTyr-binding forkhead associated (FHA) protein